MHSQYMYFELGMYFLMNTLLISILVVPTLAKNMVYSLTSALLVKIWANLKAPPRRRITGLLGILYHTSNHCYTGCNSKTYAVRFSRLLTIFLPNFRIIDQHLLLSWADLHGPQSLQKLKCMWYKYWAYENTLVKIPNPKTKPDLHRGQNGNRF